MRSKRDIYTIPPTEPAGDNRVHDRDRYLDDRRREILAHIALWERSRKPYARDELGYWQAELERLDQEAAPSTTDEPGAGGGPGPVRGLQPMRAIAD